MATLVVTPNPARVGESILVFGEGFLASTPVAISVPRLGFAAELNSDAGGIISNDDVNDHADGVLTGTGIPLNNETVTIGSRTYTFKTTLTGAANEVLIGAALTNALDNLKAAINGGAGIGTLYGAGTVAHADVIAGTKTATTLAVVARQPGTGGNAIASTDVATVFSWGNTTLVGGAADPTGVKLMDFTPTDPGTYDINATDGTNTATTKVQVFRSN